METQVRAECPKCGVTGQVPPAFVGKELHCRRCGHQFKVVAHRPEMCLEDVLKSDEDIGLAPLTPEEEAQEARVKAKLLSQMRDEGKKLHEA